MTSLKLSEAAFVVTATATSTKPPPRTPVALTPGTAFVLQPHGSWLSLEDTLMLGEHPLCPVHPKCKLDDVAHIASHLRDRHDVTEHEAADGVVDINLQLPDDKPSKQIVLLRFDDHLFLWTFESRQRADGEVQASVVVQLLPSASVSASSTPEKNSTTTATAAPFPLSRQQSFSTTGYEVKVLLGEATEGEGDESVEWEAPVENFQNKRHDCLVGQQKGASILFPTHSRLFRRGDKLLELRTVATISCL